VSQKKFKVTSVWPQKVTYSNNAGLLVDKKIRTWDMYHTVDKAIRHTISTISSSDGQCQQRKLKEKWGKSCERASLSMSQWSSHLLTMRFESQLPPLTHLSPRFNFRLEHMQKALGKTAPSCDFPHFSFSFLCWQWPSEDEIVEIVCRIALSTLWYMSHVLIFLSTKRPAL